MSADLRGNGAGAFRYSCVLKRAGQQLCPTAPVSLSGSSQMSAQIRASLRGCRGRTCGCNLPPVLGLPNPDTRRDGSATAAGIRAAATEPGADFEDFISLD